MNPPGVSILIACRNEQENILPCLQAVTAALPKAEVIVIHGGTDQTAARAEAWAASRPAIRVIRHQGDRGKGHAIKTGISLARGDVMAQFDADLQFDPADLPALLDPIIQGRCDLCVGSRFLRDARINEQHPSPARNVGNRLLAAYTSLLIGQSVSDVTSGMKAWSRQAITCIQFQDDAYSYEVELIVRAARLGLRLHEIPVHYTDRIAGNSMHRNLLALAQAGLVILAKATKARVSP